MHRHARSGFAIVALLASGAASAQIVFSEDFNPGTETACVAPIGGPGTYAFPPGWLLRNVDNRTPNAQVAYVNEAWEVREDFAQDVSNCVAFSTSWYAPEGAADDWMWTPSILVPAGGQLRWRAKAYDPSFPDGYEVRIMVANLGPPTGGPGAIGNQVTNSTLLFSIAAENTAWTERTVSLAAFAGQSAYIAFRNASNNQFILVVDDVTVFASGPNLRLVTPAAPGPWARIPTGLATGYALAASVRNSGTASVPSATVSATSLRDGVASGPPVAADPVGPVAAGATVAATWGATPPAPATAGSWSTRYVVDSPGDIDLADNTIDSRAVLVGGSELSRYTDAPTGTLGIGAGNGGEIATVLEVPSPITVVGVRLRMEGRSPPAPPAMDLWTDRPIVARIRAADASGVPQDPVLAETQAGLGTLAAQTYDLPLATPLTLPAGRYAVSAVEPPNADSMTLALHAELYEPNLNRVTWPTSPIAGWTPLESFGGAFTRTPQIGLLTGLELFRHGFEPVQAPPSAAAAGAAAAATDEAARRRGSPAPGRLADAVKD